MDGKLVWKLSINGVYTDCAPTCSDGFVYVSTGILRGETSYQCKVLKVNLEDGEIVWQTTLANSPLAGSPTVADGKVFVCCSNFEYSGIRNGYVIAYKLGALMYSLDTESGKTLGTFDLGNMYMDITPVFDGKLLTVSGGTVAPMNFIARVNPDDLTKTWMVNPKSTDADENENTIYTHMPVVSGDWVLNGTDDGHLYAYNLKDSNKNWSNKAGIGIRLGIVATDHYIYLNEGNSPNRYDQKSGRAKFKVLELETGKRVWEYEMEALGKGAVTVFDKYIYTFDKKNLYCFVKYEKPGINISPDQIDLGNIAVDEAKSFSFKAYNSGDGKIVCLSQFDDFFLSTKFMKFELTRTPVEVTFTVHPGLLFPGYDFKSTIRILGDNGQTVEFILTFHTITPERLKVTPTTIFFGAVKTGSAPQSSITLENTGRGLLNGSVYTFADWIIIDQKHWDGNKQSILLTADTSELEPGRTYNADIYIVSNGGTEVVKAFIAILPP